MEGTIKKGLMLGLGFCVVVCISCKDRKPLVYMTIHESAEHGDVQDVKRHLQRGTEVNSINLQGATALHVAVNERHIEVVKLLIERGANVNAPFPYVGTALDIAEKRAEFKIMDLLISHGAKHGKEL